MAEEIETTETDVDEDPNAPEGAEDGTPESSQEEGAEPEGDEPEGDEPAPAANAKPAAKVEIELPTIDGIKRLPDETDREWAQRLEINRLRTKLHGISPSKELGAEPAPKPAPEKKEPSEKLKKYKAEDVAALREVFSELAPELGFVNKDEMEKIAYTKEADAQIAGFIKDYPEFSPEKDPDQLLWKQVIKEFQTVYKQPADPKDFRKILERIRKDVFGIQPKGPLPKDAAAREKVKVASHGGAQTPQAPRAPARASGGSIRTEMLKGFTDEQIAAIQARAAE